MSNRVKLKQKLFSLAVIIALAVAVVLPQGVSAAQITGRALTLSSSAGAASSVTYTFTFTVPSATVLKSFQAQICTTASGSCTTPTGWTGASADLASQPTNYGDASGWTDESTSSVLRFKKTGNVAAPSSSQTAAFNGVTNPTANNTSFYARITTYSDDAYTTSVDTGTVAASTATQITVSAAVDETLTFCAGTSMTGTDCGTVSGSSVNLGTLTTTSTGSGTSVMAASTNAGSGYAVTINGATLTSGANTITAMSTATTSTQNSEQFGVNVRDNATPNVGADPTDTTNLSYGSGYGTIDTFKFVTADTVVSKNAASTATKFTVSYIANIDGATQPGTYQGTYTYICTATF